VFDSNRSYDQKRKKNEQSVDWEEEEEETQHIHIHWAKSDATETSLSNLLQSAPKETLVKKKKIETLFFLFSSPLI
jgi:hypothetical protein